MDYSKRKGHSQRHHFSFKFFEKHFNNFSIRYLTKYDMVYKDTDIESEIIMRTQLPKFFFPKEDEAK